MIKNQGMTLIEVLISIAILAIIFALALPALSDFKQTQGLRNTAEDIVALLNEARSSTLASESGNFFNVQFEADRATIFAGSVLDGSDPYTKELFFDNSITLPVENINIANSTDTVSFDKVSGDTANNGTLVLELVSDPSKTKIITILKTGVIYAN